MEWRLIETNKVPVKNIKIGDYIVDRWGLEFKVLAIKNNENKIELYLDDKTTLSIFKEDDTLDVIV